MLSRVSQAEESGQPLSQHTLGHGRARRALGVEEELGCSEQRPAEAPCSPGTGTPYSKEQECCDLLQLLTY